MNLAQFQKLIDQHPMLTRHTDARPLTSKEPTGKSPNRKHAISYELTYDDNWDGGDGDDFEPAPPKPKKSGPAGPKSLRVTVTLSERPHGTVRRFFARRRVGAGMASGTA